MKRILTSFILGMLICAPAVALADDIRAIAVGQDPTDGAWVISYSGYTGSRVEPIRTAQNECRSWGGINCVVEVIFNKGCYYGVKGEDIDGNENWALGRDLSEARNECSIGGYDCSVKWIGGCIGDQ